MDVQELVRGYVLLDAQVPVMLLVYIHVLRLVTGHVERHVWHQANVTNVQIFAKVVVMEVAMVRVNPLQKEKILRNLKGKISIKQL